MRSRFPQSLADKPRLAGPCEGSPAPEKEDGNVGPANHSVAVHSLMSMPFDGFCRRAGYGFTGAPSDAPLLTVRPPCRANVRNVRKLIQEGVDVSFGDNDERVIVIVIVPRTLLPNDDRVVAVAIDRNRSA